MVEKIKQKLNPRITRFHWQWQRVYVATLNEVVDRIKNAGKTNNVSYKNHNETADVDDNM